MFAKGVRLLMLTLAGVVPSGGVWAQRSERQPIGQPLINDLQVAAKVQVNAELPGDVLAREVGFMATVGELSPTQTESLRQEAQKTLDRWGARLDNPTFPEALRRELTPLLRDISRPGWEKFDAQRARLEGRRRRAALLARVALLDEALLLTSEQRTALCERSAHPDADTWWQPENRTAFLVPAERWLADVSADGLGSFDIPWPQLEAVLGPAQVMAYKKFKSTPVQGTIILRQGKKLRMDISPPLEVQRRGLEVYLERLVDAADAACGLSEAQREKLALAGKMDIERFRERFLADASVETDDPATIFKRQAGLAALVGASRETLGGPASHFRKALGARLKKEQQEKLAAAEHERHAFRRQALVEVVVVGFERSAALTSAQGAALTQTLNDAVAACDSTPDWRIDCLRTIAELPDNRLQPIFADEQWPGAKRHLAKLAEVVDHWEAVGAEKAVLLRAVKGMNERHDGSVELEFEADEVKLDVQ